jgi:hypothetical protein
MTRMSAFFAGFGFGFTILLTTSILIFLVLV